MTASACALPAACAAVGFPRPCFILSANNRVTTALCSHSSDSSTVRWFVNLFPASWCAKLDDTHAADAAKEENDREAALFYREPGADAQTQNVNTQPTSVPGMGMGMSEKGAAVAPPMPAGPNIRDKSLILVIDPQSNSRLLRMCPIQRTRMSCTAHRLKIEMMKTGSRSPGFASPHPNRVSRYLFFFFFLIRSDVNLYRMVVTATGAPLLEKIGIASTLHPLRADRCSTPRIRTADAELQRRHEISVIVRPLLRHLAAKFLVGAGRVYGFDGPFHQRWALVLDFRGRSTDLRIFLNLTRGLGAQFGASETGTLRAE
ncbi:hypothetical protein C8R43DRAFT_965814 [Mycena crocata]|nr:hypothetical protein C8R43DRAFT_965814 [Mycena crocata]